MRLLTRELLLRAAEALEESAHMEAGRSQEPYLVTKTETEQWADAQVLRAAAKEMPQ